MAWGSLLHLVLAPAMRSPGDHAHLERLAHLSDEPARVLTAFDHVGGGGSLVDFFICARQ